MRTKAILVCLFLIISAIGVRATTYKTIYSFSSWDDGENPYPGVIFDQAGNLYGVVAWGEESQGTVFQLTPSPGRWWTYNSWHQFGMQDPDGAGPIGGLAMDRLAISTEPPAPTLVPIGTAARSSRCHDPAVSSF